MTWKSVKFCFWTLCWDSRHVHQSAGSASARASYLRQVFKAPRDSGEVALRLARAEGEHREQRAETPRAGAHGGENTTKPDPKIRVASVSARAESVLGVHDNCHMKGVSFTYTHTPMHSLGCAWGARAAPRCFPALCFLLPWARVLRFYTVPGFGFVLLWNQHPRFIFSFSFSSSHSVKSWAILLNTQTHTRAFHTIVCVCVSKEREMLVSQNVNWPSSLFMSMHTVKTWVINHRWPVESL